MIDLCLFFLRVISEPLVAVVAIVELIKPDVKIAANHAIFTNCSF